VIDDDLDEGDWMRAGTRTIGLLLATMLALTGCSVGRGATLARTEAEAKAAAGRRAAAAAKMENARTLADGGKYDAAIDGYLQVVSAAKADSETVGQALLGASLALNRKVEGFRLPGQIDAMAKFQKRLPAGTTPDAAQNILKDYLTAQVVREAKEAESLLADRRSFVKQIRSSGSAEVLLTPKKDRLLTESEVRYALGRLPSLHVSEEYTKLYQSALPLATTMDRFLADDARYLDGKTVTDHDLSELDKSCTGLADTLWPVQRQLDRLKPGWR
jgi:hypothetical protein